MDNTVLYKETMERIHRIIGFTSILLPILVVIGAWFGKACSPFIDSISQYYFTRLGGDIFVMCLAFMGVLFLFAIDIPKSKDFKIQGFVQFKPIDKYILKLVGLSCLGVALFPATGGLGCEPISSGISRGYIVKDLHFYNFFLYPSIFLNYIHFMFALVLFGLLGYICLGVFTRDQSGGVEALYTDCMVKKRRRNMIYQTCGYLIYLSIAIIILKTIFIQPGTSLYLLWDELNSVYWLEVVMLWSFGISYCIKGRIGLFKQFYI